MTMMRTRPIPVLAGALLALSSPSLGQDPAAQWRVPVHSHGGDYGWWAAGPSYKASFHDGFEFHPYLGSERPERVSLRWTTASVTAGARSLIEPGAQARHAHSDWRYEYRWGAVTEAYDVRVDGVEQTFVIHARPAAGDLVVTGRLETTLRAAVQPEAAHGALVFGDAREQPLVRYGAAFAIDASGARLPIATAFDGERVRLTVPAAWLAGALFPVTIDPLTSAVTIRNEGASVFGTAIGREGESASANVMVAYARSASLFDTDVVAVLTNDDFSSPVVVFADLSATNKADSPDVAFCGGADRWALAFAHQAPALPFRVRVYLHGKGNTTLNSGITLTHEPGTETNLVPAIGGSATGIQALLVYRSGVISPLDLYGVVVNASAATLGPRARLNPTTLDVSAADVSSGPALGETNWLVAYQAITRGMPGDDHDVYVTKVDPAALGSGTSVLVGSDASSPPHKVAPVIDGTAGRYLLAMALATSALPAEGGITTQRIDWPENASMPTVSLPRTLIASTHRKLDVAYDSVSRSHWAVVGEWVASGTPSVFRLGPSGAPLESVQVNCSDMAVTYAPSRREYLIAYQVSGTVFGQRLQYPADAINVPYGTKCGDPSFAIDADPPFAASRFFQIRFSGPPLNTNCALFLSFAPDALPLDALGMNACVLNVSTLAGQFLASVPAVVGAGNTARVTVPLQETPLFTGNLFGQWLWLQPGLNPLGVGATGGLRMQVR